MFEYARVSVERSEHTKQIVDVPTWEVPVLEMVHGADYVKVIGKRSVRRAKHDAQDEYNRLVGKYRTSEENGQPIAAFVYGGGTIGVQKLAEEIAKVPEVEDPLADTDDIPEFAIRRSSKATEEAMEISV
jgi:hypothetical protein